MPTEKHTSGQCAPDVALPSLHAYPEDQKSAGEAFCQLQWCKICKESGRGKEREDMKTNKRRT